MVVACRASGILPDVKSGERRDNQDMDNLAFIQETLQRAVYVLLPFFVCLNVVMLLDRLAPQLGLLDLPDARKQHDGQVPLIGGPAMYVAIASASILLNFHFSVLIFLALGLVLIVLGIVDDRYDIPPVWRLVVQALVAAVMVYVGGVQISQIGDLFGAGPVVMTGTASVLFTIVCTIGVINAVNMIDGVDGLAGSVLLMSFTGMTWLALSGGNVLGAEMLTIFGGAILGFLCFNARVFVSRARIFMGDSGSMLMGFILAWFFISLTQGEQPAMSAVTAGWLFGLPLVDTVSVMVRRLLDGKSPFHAGRDHLHHRLLDSGLSVNATVLIMSAIHGVMVLVGVYGNGDANLEPWLFWGFVMLVIAHHYGTPRLLERVTASVHGVASRS